MWIGRSVDPEQADAEDILSTSLVPRTSIWSSPSVPEGDTFGAAFGAAFQRENTIASLYHSATSGQYASRQQIDSARDSGFNPYSYLRETYDPQTLERLKPYISRGEFEGALTPGVASSIVDSIIYEQDLIKHIGQNGWGAFAGSIAAAALDPTTYLPFLGQVGAAGKLGKVGLFALNAALSSGASEAVLRLTQRERSFGESLLNIGTSGLLGGGVGIFAAALSRGSAIHPGHPNNPLRVENLDKNGEIIRTLDGKVDDLSHEELSVLELEADGAGASLGAARQGGTSFDTRIARREPKTIVGKAVRKVGDFFNTKTIVGRVVRASSGLARSIGLSLMDPGAILLKGHLAGKSLAPSAEAIKKNFMGEVDALYDRLATNTHNLNMELSQAGVRKVDHADVLQLTQRRLFDMQDDDLLASLDKKYGSNGTAKLIQTADTNAAAIHGLNDVWEKRLLKEGILQNDSLVKTLQGEVGKGGALVKQIETHPGALKEATPDQKADLKRLRDLRDAKRATLAAEVGKAKPLGKAYGHAQLWNREGILENPDDFKAFLLDALAVNPNAQWLMDAHGITPDDLDALKLNDRDAYRSIITDWAGDEHYWRINRTEQELAAQQEALKSAKLDLRGALSAAGVAERGEKSVTTTQARLRRDKIAAELAATRAERDRVKQEQHALVEGATAARSEGFDRLNTERPDAPANTTGRAPDQSDPDGLAAAIADHLSPKRAEEAAAGDRAARKDVDVSNETARQQGRAEEAAARIADLDRKEAQLAARVKDIDEHLTNVERLAKDVEDTKGILDDVVDFARKHTGIAEKSVAKIKRALLKTRKQTPLDDLVDEMTTNLTQVGHLNAGIMDRMNEIADRTTGRVKERAISLDPARRIEAIKRGWLKDDLSQVLYHQYDQLASELAIREGVGIGPGRQFGSWKEVTQSVHDDYNQMIEGITDAAAKGKLRKERDIMVDDIIAGRDRLRGVYDEDGTTHGWIKWGSSKFRQANFIRYGSGFLLSSLTDTATVGLRHGPLWKLLSNYGPAAIKEMRKVLADNPSEFESFISSTELGLGAAASARRFGAEDLIHGAYANYGIGHGRTRSFTGAIDKTLDKVGHVVATWSGLPVWNRFWKTVAGLAMRDKLNRMTRAYDTLGDHEIADLASLGIGKTEASRIRTFLEQHGKTEDGHFDPHLEDWGTTTEALAASRDFRIAITRDMDRAINTPGIGDTPRLMSKWYGKLALQFQTFAFTFMNRYAYPSVQRASLFQERQAFMSMAILFMAATTVMLGRDLISGRNPEDRFKSENATKSIHEIIDRSGFLGWTSPYADSALKLTAPITHYGGSDRYAGRGWAEPMLGINYGLFADIQRAGEAAANRDPNFAKKALVLAPFNSQARLFYNQILE